MRARKEIAVGLMKAMRRWGAVGVAGALVAGVIATGVASAGAGAAPITAGGVQAQQPSVSGSRVVWSDYRSGQWDVWLYDAAIKRARKITSGSGDKVQPAISGDTIVYVAYSATTKGDIYAYDIRTRATKLLNPTPNINGDQLNPVISGAWVAWEDYSSSFNNTKVFAHNLVSGVTMQIAGNSSFQYSRPRIAGDLLVYQRVYQGRVQTDTTLYPERPYQYPGQTDLMYVDLAVAPSTGPLTSAPLTDEPIDERIASTDGRYVAWMRFAGETGYDIQAKDMQTGDLIPVTSAPGEQAIPVVGNGVVYWVDNRSGVQINSKNLKTGALGTFPYRTRIDIAGLAASGDSLTWLQPQGGRWIVKVLLSAPVPGVNITALLPSSSFWSAFNFATLSSGGDVTSPSVKSASVSAGELNVDGTAPLTVQFSEPMSAASVNSKTVKVVKSATGSTVPAKVTYSSLTKTAVVTPSAPLDGSYALRVSAAVADAAGNTAGTGYVVAFATEGSPLIAAFAPSVVGGVTPRIVSESGQVYLTWNPGGDPDGDLVGYQVKRFTAATLDPGTFSAAATLTPTSGPMTIVGTSATFNPASDELSRTSTYYYAVVAVDAAGNRSQTWYNSSPNPHSTEVNGMNTNSCTRCHSVHGASAGGLLGARGAGSCYRCHGSTDQASTVGTNSVNNIQGEFFDYPIASMTAGPTEPSRHGNAFIRANVDNNQCDMCHAPHKRSYNDSEAISYRKLLKRSQVASDTSSTVLYSTDAAPFGKELCFNCHGSGGDELTPGASPYTNMYYYGGPQAYANSAGEHNQSAWDTVGTAGPAHGTQTLNDALRNLALGGTLPRNACQVCHAEHGSESVSLLAYRRSDITTNLADKGGLCLKCHGSGPEAASPNTWNSRNVATEFARAGSSHPTSTVAASIMVTLTAYGTPGLIDTQTDWTNYTTRIDVDVVTSAGSAILANTGVSTPNTEPFLFSKRAAATGFSAFSTGQTAPGAWNDKYIPSTTNSPATVAGSSSFAVNGNVYVVRGGATQIDRYAPPAGSGTGTWTQGILTTVLPFSPGAGSSSAVNTRSADQFVYISRASHVTPATVAAWKYTGTAMGTLTLRTNAGGGLTLGSGSSIAYAPGANRLFIINKTWSGTNMAGDGDLYWYNAPGGATANLNAVNATGLDLADSTTGTTQRYNRLVYFSKGGAEYLAYVGMPNGTSYTNTNPRLMVISNLAGTPGTANVIQQGWAWGTTTNPGAGVDVQWDGGDYLYVQRGGSTDIARWRIPANPTTANSGTWETLTALPTAAGEGSSFIVQNAAPTSFLPFKPSGTVTVDNVAKAPGHTAWSSVAWEQTLNGQTILLDVLDGATGNTIPGFTGLSSGTADLQSLSNSTLDFRFTLSTGDNRVSPSVDKVEVFSAGQAAQSLAGTTTCYNCHNTHFVGEGAAGTAWDVARVSDPLDTNLRYTGAWTNFCMRCHGTAGYNATTGAISINAVKNSATQLIPYAIGMRGTTDWPFFTSWNKSDFTLSGHYSTATNKALCQNCHDPHGSNNKALTAWTRPAWFGTGLAGTRDNTTVAANESNLCFQCHGNSGVAIGGFTGRTATGAGDVRMDIATPMNLTYKHDTAVANKHTDKETATALATGNRHAECTDCHDPHRVQQVGGTPTPVHTAGSSVAGGALYGAVGLNPTWTGGNWNATATYDRIRLAGGTGDYEAYVCFKCHTAYTTLPATASNLALEFNPANQAGHNVLGTRTTWPKETTGQGLPNTFTFPSDASAFVAGKSKTYKLTCSECHTNSNTAQARGPHGSGVYSMLRSGSAATTWYSTTLTNYDTAAQNVCNDCHLKASNNVHSDGNHGSYTCDRCHIKVPHGWKRPRMLIRYGVDNPGGTATQYITGTTGSLGAIELQNYTNPSGWAKGDCDAGCSTGDHPAATTPWP